MKNNMEKAKPLLHFVPAILVAVVVGIILTGYEKPFIQDLAAETIHMITQETQPAQEMDEESEGDFSLKDGLYQGSGTGFGGEIIVAVEIENQTMKNIWILAAEHEDEAFLNRAKALIQVMLDTQTPEVDVVSGATYSSNGIIEAVKDALKGNSILAQQPSEEGTEEVDYSNLMDGDYTGEGEGFGGQIRVQIHIEDGKLTDIRILEALGEDAAYLNKAKTLISLMIKAQSPEVDAVSGATYSSNGLKEAVSNAMKKAMGTSVQDETTQATGKAGNWPYVDGIYYGTGTGFAGDLTVAVAIYDHTITAAVIVETSDDEAFLKKARKILDLVVKQQTTDIDAVSGATYSSEGILEALKNAIKSAEKATNGQDSDSNSDTDSETSPPTETTTEDNGELIYQDGTYSITTICNPDARKAFAAYTLSMKVTIKNDRITKVTDVKGSGSGYVAANDSFIKKAVSGTSSKQGVVTQIVASGKATGIDVVSGATCTSDSIIAGCKKALSEAKLDPSIPDETESQTQETTTAKETDPETTVETTESGETSESVGYRDGVYEGISTCYPDDWEEFEAYEISLKITISGGNILSIGELTPFGDAYDVSNEMFIEMASELLDTIKSKGTVTGVDVISGATCSSDAIKEACRQALEAAKK